MFFAVNGRSVTKIHQNLGKPLTVNQLCRGKYIFVNENQMLASKPMLGNGHSNTVHDRLR